MLVDPNTGLPLYGAPYPTQSWGDVVAGAYDVTPEKHKLLYGVLANMPTAKETAGWNAWRASRTVLNGPLTEGRFSRRLGHGMLANHLNPRSWTRFTSGNVITGAAESYSPFNTLSWLGNSVVRNAAKHNVMGIDGALARRGLTPADGASYFSRGTYPVIASSMKLANAGAVRGGSPRLQKKIANSLQFIEGQDADLFRAGSKYMFAGADLDKNVAATLLSAVPRGTLSSTVSGYMAGARGLGSPGLHAAIAAERPAWGMGYKSAVGVLDKAGLDVGEKIGMAGARTIIEKAGVGAGSKFLAARAIGMAIPGVDIAMTAWMISDIAKMGFAAMKGGVEFAKDAGVSMRGDVNKGVMGMGYKDNTVAATSRARGVMAIQNSQLNARSVLGSEASMMAAHFG